GPSGPRATVWQKSSARDLGVNGRAHSINNQSQIVGTMLIPSSGQHAFAVRALGVSPVDLGFLPTEMPSAAYGLPRNGFIAVGRSGKLSFVHRNDVMIALPLPVSYVFAEARAVNDHRVICGTVWDWTRPSACVWRPTGNGYAPLSLPMPAGADMASAWGIGPDGSVIGNATRTGQT